MHLLPRLLWLYFLAGSMFKLAGRILFWSVGSRLPTCLCASTKQQHQVKRLKGASRVTARCIPRAPDVQMRQKSEIVMRSAWLNYVKKIVFLFFPLLVELSPFLFFLYSCHPLWCRSFVLPVEPVFAFYLHRWARRGYRWIRERADRHTWWW